MLYNIHATIQYTCGLVCKIRSMHYLNEPPLVLQDAGSTSEYSSLSSLDRLDGMSLRERVLEMETNAMKQVEHNFIYSDLLLFQNYHPF